MESQNQERPSPSLGASDLQVTAGRDSKICARASTVHGRYTEGKTKGKPITVPKNFNERPQGLTSQLPGKCCQDAP